MKENVFEGNLVVTGDKVHEYTQVTGSIDIREGGKLSLPKLTSCGGNIHISEGGKLSLPKLTSCGGSIYIYEGGKLSLPKLTSCGGYIYIREGGKLSLPKLTSCGGSIYIREGGKLSLPKLTSCGGYIDIREGGKFSQSKNIKQNDTNAVSICRLALSASFALSGFSFADKILAKIVSKRGPVTRVLVCGKNKISYLVTDGEVHSHGATLREARDGLLYKIGNRDTTEFKKWTLNKKVSKRDAIRAYRTITGACEGGVRDWMEQRKTPDTITVKKVIKLTEGAYGSDTFAKFFEEYNKKVSKKSCIV